MLIFHISWYKLLSNKEFGNRSIIPNSKYDINRRRNEMKKINDFLAGIPMTVIGALNPTTGALVHNAGSCFVVLIAALLYDRKFDK